MKAIVKSVINLRSAFIESVTGRRFVKVKLPCAGRSRSGGTAMVPGGGEWSAKGPGTLTCCIRCGPDEERILDVVPRGDGTRNSG